MASSVIHIAVANELNKVLKKDKKSILIGSIAPDISKLLGDNKVKSHFQDSNNDIPNLNKFVKKYGNRLDDDFVLGYYIHLYTDYLWFKYFVPDFCETGSLYKLDGTKEFVDDNKKLYYFYNDYTNLNIKLIDEYDLDLRIFYEEIPSFDEVITEIPMNKINLIIDKAGIIIENTKESKAYVFDMKVIKKFIDTSVKYIFSDLKDRCIN